MNPGKVFTVRFWAIPMLVLLACGCGRGSTGGGTKSEEAEHMRRAAALVGQYQQATKKQPAKIEEVRDWAVKEGKASEDDFASTRDKEPYAIGFTTRGLIIHEQSGKNGKCYMLGMGGVSEVAVEDARSMLEQHRVGPGGRPDKK